MSNTLIPAEAAELMVTPKKSNQELIISYLISEPGTVTLTEEQEQLLKRWNHADDLIRQNRYSTNSIVKLLQAKYDISSATAFRDLKAVEYVFGTTRKNNKNYLLANHMDWIKQMQQKIEAEGRLELIPKIADAYTNALKLIPEDRQTKTTPVAIVLNVTQVNVKQLIQDTLTPEEAGIQDAEVLSEYGLDDLNSDDDEPEEVEV